MPIIQVSVGQDFRDRWLPAKELGQGGGGKVYRCVHRSIVDEMIRFNQHSGGISLPEETRKSICADLIDNLHDHLFFNRNGVAAVKVPHDLNDSGNMERFRREITAMQSCTHPALVRLIDYDPQPAPRWFAMDYHPHGTLKECAETYKGKSLECLLAIRPIIEGTSKLHASGYIHRDIKPNNIFVTVAGDLVSGDLGIVFPREEEEGRLTQTGDTLFSRDWIPDWIRFSDSPPETKVDVFMLAKVMYYMITGGRKVLASQLDEPEFDLRSLFPTTKGIEDLYKLLRACITTKDRNCELEDAGQLLAAVDEQIDILLDRSKAQLLFSFLSSHETTHLVVVRPDLESTRYPQLRGIPIFLPHSYRRFMARARVISPGPSHEVCLVFAIDEECSNTLTASFPRSDPGHWTEEISMRPRIAMTRGWHTLHVRALSPVDGGRLTGFMLYGE